MSSLLQDMGFAFRSFISQPVFSLVAILTIALGIGGATAMFSVVHAVLLRPLDFEEPDRLMRVRNRNSHPDMTDWIEQNQTVEAFGGYGWSQFDLTGNAEPERITGSVVSGHLFRMLRTEAALGRTIVPEDDRPGAEPVVVLSDGFWRRRLGADRNVLGKTISLSGNPYAVVGVMPRGFRLPEIDAELWVPCWVAFPESTGARGAHNLIAIGRLKDGVALEQARADMDGIADRLEALYPDENTDRRFVLVPWRDHIVQDTRTALLILFGAVGFVLLIACANVANLLLARAANRRREIAIRTALGAGKLRLFRQLLTESVLLSVIGGAVGLALAQILTRVLVIVGPEDIPRLHEVAVDGRVLAFAFAVSVLTGIVFGLAPGVHASKLGLGDSLKEGGRSLAGSVPQRFRSGLIAAQLALAVVLLIGAGLLFRSFMSLQSVDPGFYTERLLTMDFSLPVDPYREIPRRILFFQRVLEQIQSLPGTEAVALTTDLPFGTGSIDHNLAFEGRPVEPGTEPEIGYRGISPSYFEVMNIPLLEGRGFTDQDREGSLPVAIINRQMARQYYPDQSPVGQRIRWARRETIRWMTIVGVVEDVRSAGLDADDAHAVYAPFMQQQQWWRTWMSVVVRTSTNDPMTLASAIKREVADIDPNLPVANMQPMIRLIADSSKGRRFHLLLLTSFAAIALALAAVGIYGVLSYAVAQRRNELGIRIAMGAKTGDILGIVIRQGMLLTAVGLVIGVALAFAVTRVMVSLLFEVTPTDPVTFAGVALVLSLVALAASFFPARHATRVDPLEALRYE
jgi:putative ABC transport system permease protein